MKSSQAMSDAIDHQVQAKLNQKIRNLKNEKIKLFRENMELRKKIKEIKNV